MYDFNRTAVRCDNWAQMTELSRNAKEQGKRAHMFNENDFNCGMNLFLVDRHVYMNYTKEAAEHFNYTVVDYSTFIHSNS